MSDLTPAENPWFRRICRRVMVLVMMADDFHDVEEYETIENAYEALTGIRLTHDDLDHEEEQAEEDVRTMGEYLVDFRRHLDPEARGLIVRAAYMVAHADDDLQSDERRILREIGDALELTAEEVAAAIAG